MTNKKRQQVFSFEFRKRLIQYTVDHMSIRQAQKAAMYYFDDNRAVLAERLAEDLAESREETIAFYENFKLPPWKEREPIEDIIAETVYYETARGKQLREEWRNRK